MRFGHLMFAPDAAAGPETVSDGAYVNPTGDAGPENGEGLAEWQPLQTKPFEELADEKAQKTEHTHEQEIRSEQPPPQDRPADEASPEAAEETAQTADTESGETLTDDPVKASEDDAVRRIMDRFQNDPRKLGKGYLHQQRLASKKDADKQNAINELDQALSRVEKLEEFFDFQDDGTPVLRPEMAVQAMSQGAPPIAEPDEASVRRAVEQRYRETFGDDVEQDFVDQRIQQLKPRIDQEVQQELQSVTRQQRDRLNYDLARAGNVIDLAVRNRPELEAVLPELDKALGRYPPQLRAQALLQKWVDVPQFLSDAHQRQNIETSFRTAFQEGFKAGQHSLTPSDGGRPSAHPRAPGVQGEASPDDSIKQSILKAGGLSSLEDLFGG